MSVYITRKWNRYCNTVSRTHNSNVPGQIVHMQGGRAATRARMTSNRRTDYLVFSMVKRHGFVKKNRKNLVMGRLRSGNPCGGERNLAHAQRISVGGVDMCSKYGLAHYNWPEVMVAFDPNLYHANRPHILYKINF